MEKKCLTKKEFCEAVVDNIRAKWYTPDQLEVAKLVNYDERTFAIGTGEGTGLALRLIGDDHTTTIMMDEHYAGYCKDLEDGIDESMTTLTDYVLEDYRDQQNCIISEK